MIRLAINGYGRIGRCVLRAIYENNLENEFKVIAINNIGNIEATAHLTKYDTTHGVFNIPISAKENHLLVKDDDILATCERDPSKLPWKELDIDIVLECTGAFRSKETAMAHIRSGAKKVLISAPGKADVDATIVYGVNHKSLKATDLVVSNASCTTNCLAPLVKPLSDTIGVETGFMTTVHAYTNDQVLADVYHTDLRRARAATQSIIPTATGAATSIGLVIPELKGKLDGFALRVPVSNVSIVDLSFIAKKKTTVNEVNDILTNAANNELKNILAVNNLPLVSVDFIHRAESCIFDTTQTKLVNNLVKVLGWYDNEWGFANRMLDTAKYMKEIQ